jgi:hypothetical protein
MSDGIWNYFSYFTDWGFRFWKDLARDFKLFGRKSAAKTKKRNNRKTKAGDVEAQ